MNDFSNLRCVYCYTVCQFSEISWPCSSKIYQSVCEALKRDDLTRSLVDDLNMMQTYDPEMFCFAAHTIFSDFSHSELYNAINNTEIIRLLASTIDPTSLNDIMCLCLTGSLKIISREEPMSVIGKRSLPSGDLSSYST